MKGGVVSRTMIEYTHEKRTVGLKCVERSATQWICSRNRKRTRGGVNRSLLRLSSEVLFKKLLVQRERLHKGKGKDTELFETIRTELLFYSASWTEIWVVKKR